MTRRLVRPRHPRSRTHRALHAEDAVCGAWLGCHGPGDPWWPALPQLPQLRLGGFGFQGDAFADWPTGGLRFGGRSRRLR